MGDFENYDGGGAEPVMAMVQQQWQQQSRWVVYGGWRVKSVGNKDFAVGVRRWKVQSKRLSVVEVLIKK